MPAATMTTKGQTTIPREIRELLKLQPGDRIDFVVENGRVYLAPCNIDIRNLSGILQREGRVPVSLAAMEEAMAVGACESAGAVE